MEEDDKEAKRVLSCSDCGSRKTERGSAGTEIYCRSCGALIEEQKVDTTSETRAFNEKERKEKKRSGGSVTYAKADRGISTKIGNPKELYKVSGEKRGQYSRLRRWHNRDANPKKRNMSKILERIMKIVSDLGLPDTVREESGRLAEKARDKDLIQGRTMDGVAGAIVYLVARNHSVPRKLEEVAEKIGMDQHRLGKTYRYVARELDADIKPIDALDLLPRYVNEMGLGGRYEAKVREVIEMGKDERIFVGNSPDSVIASAIYYVSTIYDIDNITQRKVADTVGVTTVTVRNGYQELGDELDENQIKDQKKLLV